MIGYCNPYQRRHTDQNVLNAKTRNSYSWNIFKHLINGIQIDYSVDTFFMFLSLVLFTFEFTKWLTLYDYSTAYFVSCLLFKLYSILACCRCKLSIKAMRRCLIIFCSFVCMYVCCYFLLIPFIFVCCCCCCCYFPIFTVE